MHAPVFYGNCGEPQFPISCALRREDFFDKLQAQVSLRLFGRFAYLSDLRDASNESARTQNTSATDSAASVYDQPPRPV